MAIKFDKILGQLREADTGGGGGGISAPSAVTLSGTTPTIASLAENTNYSGTNLTSLTVSAVSSFSLESLIMFTTGSSFTATFPASLKWVNGGITFGANKGYIVAIMNGVAVAGEVS